MGPPVVAPKVPPLKGSFPLDRKGVCKEFFEKYIACTKAYNENTSTYCKKYIKEYLSCRMKNNLMNPDEFKNLGFNS